MAGAYSETICLYFCYSPKVGNRRPVFDGRSVVDVRFLGACDPPAGIPNRPPRFPKRQIAVSVARQVRAIDHPPPTGWSMAGAILGNSVVPRRYVASTSRYLKRQIAISGPCDHWRVYCIGRAVLLKRPLAISATLHERPHRPPAFDGAVGGVCAILGALRSPSGILHRPRSFLRRPIAIPANRQE